VSVAGPEEYPASSRATPRRRQDWLTSRRPALRLDGPILLPKGFAAAYGLSQFRHRRLDLDQWTAPSAS